MEEEFKHNSNGSIEALFATRRSDVVVRDVGVVERVLSDDTDGARHQRVILRLRSGHTVLVSHNIDAAPRIENIQEGDILRFKGEYEWSDLGGLIHWTHRDPTDRHEDGYLVHEGVTFE